jgi:hypothetical protein
VALGLPVVLVPEGFCEPVALPVDEAWSLLSPLLLLSLLSLLLLLLLLSLLFLLSPPVSVGLGASVALGSSLADCCSEGWAVLESRVSCQHRIWLVNTVYRLTIVVLASK